MNYASSLEISGPSGDQTLGFVNPLALSLIGLINNWLMRPFSWFGQMWYPDKSISIDEYSSSVFLLAHWRELFDPLTPDTYQPRLHNLPSLVEELGTVSGRLKKDATIWWKHIHKIREEISETAEEERGLLQSLPEYEWLLNRLLSSKSPSEIQITCKLLSHHRAEYSRVLIDSARHAIEELPKKKEKAYFAVRRLATLTIQASHEDDDVVHSLPGPEVLPGQVLESLVSATTGRNERYECVFGVIGDHSHIQKILRSIGFQLLGDASIGIDARRDLASKYSNLHFVHIVRAGRSLRDAVANSRQLLSTGVDVFNLYSNSSAFLVIDEVFVKKLESLEYTKLLQSDQAFRQLYPRTRASRDALETLDMVSGNRLEDRLLSALELHSLSFTASEPRTKFINLWSALECLAGCCDKTSVIERVIELVVPLLIWRRVDKVVRYAAIETQQFAGSVEKFEFGTGFPRSSEKFVHPWDMLLTLCKPKDHPDIVQLLNFTSKHPLLVYRLYRLWGEFSDATKLQRSLARSRRRIEWQLWRIYRARNLLVHDGQDIPLLNPLLDQLRYYSSVVLQRIIHGMKFGSDWGVRESLAYWNAKSEFVLSALSDDHKKLRVSDFFPVPANSDAPRVWDNTV